MNIEISNNTPNKSIEFASNTMTAPTINLSSAQNAPAAPSTVPLVPSAPPAQPRTQQETRPVARMPPKAQARRPEPGFDVFSGIANQTRIEQDSDSEPGFSDDNDDDDNDDNDHGNGNDGDSAYNDSNADVNYHQGDHGDYDADRPSPGYSTIEEERNALLFKIHRGIRGGMPLEKPGGDASIHELRGTVVRMENEIALDRSIKFQRRMVCMLTSSIEWINGKYSYADLDGWSDSVATSISDYDDIFEELHMKYKDSVSMAPEIRLIMALATSAFWFNLTKSMSKQISNTMQRGAIGDAPGKPGGLDLGSLLGTMMGGMKPSPNASSAPAAQAASSTPPAPMPTMQREPSQVMRKPMRGPDMSALFGGAPPPTFTPNDLPIATPSRKRTLDGFDQNPGGGKRKNTGHEDDRRDTFDRLSDIVSNDSDSDSSGSSSSGSSDSSDSSKSSGGDGSIRIETRQVGGRGRGRGRGRGAVRGMGRGTKNVVTL
jgi:hypothetical protein